MTTSVFRTGFALFLAVAAAPRAGPSLKEIKPAVPIRTTVRNIAYSPDGAWLAIPNLITAGSVGVLSIRPDGGIPEVPRAFSPQDFGRVGSVFRYMGSTHGGEAADLIFVQLPEHLPGYCVAFSPDGAALAIGGRDSVWLYDVASWKRLDLIPMPDAVESVAFSADGTLLAVAHGGGMALLKLPEGEKVESVSCGAERRFADVAFSHDGKLLAAFEHHRGDGADYRVRRWDLVDYREIGPLEFPDTGPVNPSGDHLPLIGFSADNSLLAVALERFVSRVVFVKQATREVVHTLKRGRCFDFSPNGRLVAVNGSIYASGDLNKKEYTIRAGFVRGVAFAPNGREIATLTDTEVRRWRLP